MIWLNCLFQNPIELINFFSCQCSFCYRNELGKRDQPLLHWGYLYTFVSSWNFDDTFNSDCNSLYLPGLFQISFKYVEDFHKNARLSCRDVRFGFYSLIKTSELVFSYHMLATFVILAYFFRTLLFTERDCSQTGVSRNFYSFNSLFLIFAVCLLLTLITSNSEMFQYAYPLWAPFSIIEWIFSSQKDIFWTTSRYDTWYTRSTILSWHCFRFLFYILLSDKEKSRKGTFSMFFM